MIISLDVVRAFEKNPTPIHFKSLGEISNTKDILEYNKYSLQQAHSQHQHEMRETQNNFSKIRYSTIVAQSLHTYKIVKAGATTKFK